MRTSPEIIEEIRRLSRAENWRVGTIARQLHVHHDVVRRALGLLPSRVERPVVVGALEPFAAFIAETLQRYPTLRATRLYDMLRERGYPGSPRHLRRYVATVRPRPRQEAFLHIETLVGEQAQVDWAHAGRIPVPGGMRDLWLFVMVLSHSRGMWGEFVLDLSVHQVVRSLARASAAFGGCPRQWLFDNPKTVVLERHRDAVRFHPDLLQVAGAFCVQPRLCTPGAPQQKGRVERAIRYLRDRFFAGRTIGGVEQGNGELHRFIAEVAHQRPHPSIPGRTVLQVLEEEKPRLLKLPDPLPNTDQLEPVRVDGKAFIRFDTNFYSVPTRHVGEQLTVCADDRRIRILRSDEQVAEHPRSFGRYQRFEQEQHRQELIEQRRAARAAKGRDRLTASVPRIAPLFDAWLMDGRNVGSCTMQALKLLDLYGEDVLRQAVDDVLARNIHDVSALALRCEHHRRARQSPVPVALKLGAHVPERDVIPHALEGYDDDTDE